MFALTALERAQRLFPRADPRPKITHCTLINDNLLRRIKAAGAVPAPFTSYAYYNSDKVPFLEAQTRGEAPSPGICAKSAQIPTPASGER